MSTTQQDSSTFDSILGGYKTYITAAIGIVFNVLTAFNVWNPTTEQTMAVNGAVVLLAAAFLRAGLKKVE
jgi:hypothetical protein